MIILGVVLMLIGFIAKIPILWSVGSSWQPSVWSYFFSSCRPGDWWWSRTPLLT